MNLSRLSVANHTVERDEVTVFLDNDSAIM